MPTPKTFRRQDLFKRHEKLSNGQKITQRYSRFDAHVLTRFSKVKRVHFEEYLGRRFVNVTVKEKKEQKNADQRETKIFSWPRTKVERVVLRSCLPRSGKDLLTV